MARPKHIYECGLDGCPGTVDTSHTQIACPSVSMIEPSIAARLFGGDHTLIELRVEYAKTSGLIARNVPTTPKLVVYARELAHKIPTKLGHTPLRQGNAVECAKCGMTGTASAVLTGDVFWWACGEQITPFGHERNLKDYQRRACYERACAAELRARGGIGDEALAVGHDNAAKAYDEQARSTERAIAALDELAKGIYTVSITHAVAAAIEIDNLDESIKRRVGVKRIGKGRTPSFAITGTTDDLEAFANYCERHSGFDLAPVTITACNKAAKRIKLFVAETRAGKDLP